MDIRKEIQAIVTALTLWASRARKEEVLVVRPMEFLGSTPVVNFQTGVRSGGRSGLHVVDLWAQENEHQLVHLFKEAKGYGDSKSTDWATEVTSVLPHMVPLELAKQLSDEQFEDQAELLAQLSAAADKKGESDLSKAEAWLPVAAPQSNTMLRLFWQGVPTSLNRVIQTLASDTVDLVMYVLSLLSAKIAGLFPGSKDGELKDFALVIADLSKPLYRDSNGFDRYANTAGGDGNMPFTWTDPLKDLQGQVRGFVLNLLEKFGLILKGTAVGDNVWLTPDKSAFTGTYTPGCHKVVIADLNMVKGRGKQTQQFKDTESCDSDFAVPRLVTEGELYLWFIRVVKSAEEHRGALATTFQETPFYPPEVEGEPGLGGCYTRVDRATITENLVDRICRIDNTRKALLDECLSTVCLDLEDFKLDNGKIPYCAMLESVNSDIERACSSGTFWKAQTLKSWGNQLTPCGVVLTDRRQMAYRDTDDQKAQKAYDRSVHQDYFESEYHQRGFGLFGRLVAHRRTPQLNPLSLTTSRAICHEDLKALAEALMAGESSWISYDDGELGTLDTVWAIIHWHNAKCQDKGYTGKWSSLITDANEMATRLVLWHLSLQHSNIESWFVTNPMDGRDRNEDHDGDDSACCPSRFWVEKYLKLEAFWRRSAHPFVNELPKSTKMNWRAERVNQDLPDPEGNLVSTTNIKGCSLEELFPAIEWCTPLRMKAVIKVTLSNPQGPTGLASNVAADLFARIRWVLDPSGRTNWRGERLVIPHPEDKRLFLLWVWYCLLVQICIDWQKRAYELPQLKYALVIAQAVIDAGWEGLKSFSGVIERSQLADLTTTWEEKAELATNWCYNPSLIYSFAELAIERPVCLWKWRKGQLAWRVSHEEIMADLATMPMNRFRAVGEAVHAKDGIIAEFGKAKDYVERVASALKAKTKANGLTSYIAQAFLAVESETLKAGEDGDLEKVGASYRGGLFLRALGFDLDAQETLLDGGTAKSKLTDEQDWSWADLLIAAAHGAKAREVDAFEILVSFYVSQKEVTEEAKKLTRLGEELKEEFLCGVALEPKPKDGVILPAKRGGGVPYARSMAKDLRALWEDVFYSGYDYFDASLQKIAAAAHAAASTQEERIALAKMAASRLFGVVQVARVYKDRRDVYRVRGKAVKAHRNPIALPKEEYQGELEDNPNCFGSNGKRLSSIQRGNGDELYISKRDGEYKSPYLSNWDDSHAWLSAIGHDCPTRMAYQAIKDGRPFMAHPNTAWAYEVMNKVWDRDESILVKCRTLTASGGYVTATMVDKAIGLVLGDEWEVEDDDPIRGGIIPAIQLLRGASSDLVSRWDGEFTDNGNATPEFFRQELMDGACDMFPVPAGEESWGRWLKDAFGLTPLPKSLTYGWGDKKVVGEEALSKLIQDLLLWDVVDRYITMTDRVSDARWDEYRQAKGAFLEAIEYYDLPIADPQKAAKSLFWFTAMAVNKDSTLAEKRQRFKRLGKVVSTYQELGQ